MNLATLDMVKHSPLHNYAGIPGLTSWLIAESDYCIVRMFENERDHDEVITPHSHRFDFECMVLDGKVWNTIYEVEPAEIPGKPQPGDLYQITEMECTAPGKYIRGKRARDFYSKHTTLYQMGDTYAMTFDQIHAIKFSKGARVLFIEQNKKPWTRM